MISKIHRYRLSFFFALFSLFLLYRCTGFYQEIQSPSSSSSRDQIVPPLAAHVHDEQEYVPEMLTDNDSKRDRRSSCRTTSVERNTDRNHNNAHMDFWLTLPEETIQTYKQRWQQFMKREMKKGVPSSKTFHGRGIVLVAGNGDTFSRALTTVKLLRKHGCNLPIEIWHLNDEKPSDTIASDLLRMKARSRDLSDKYLIRPIEHRRNADKQFQIKAAAIINAEFEEIIYLDSDNFPTTDPTFLFNVPEYLSTGALFWPDFWKTHAENRIYDVLDIDCEDTWEQESGQLVINKRKAWYPLLLTHYMNHHHDIYYQFLNGDKDTFRYAWKALKAPFYMNPTFLGMGGTLIEDRFCGHTMIQYPPFPSANTDVEDTGNNGVPLFVHANLLKITNKIHFLHQYQGDPSTIVERPWEWVKKYSSSVNNTWLMPEFYIGAGYRACMDFHSNQGESPTELLQFDTLLPGLQQTYFHLNGIGGETI